MYRDYRAFKNDRYYKAEFTAWMHSHEKYGHLTRGTYGAICSRRQIWTGCSTACALRSVDLLEGRDPRVFGPQHDELADALGIPVAIVHLEHWVFENLLSDELAQSWPQRFYLSMAPGLDLTYAWPRLIEMLPSIVPEGLVDLLRFMGKDPRSVHDDLWYPYRTPQGIGIPAASSVGDALVVLITTMAKEQREALDSNTLWAYRGQPEFKAEFVRKLRLFRDADQLLQGTYGSAFEERWCGCAVAASLRSLAQVDGDELRDTYSSHSELAARMGIPLTLTWLEEAIFESLPTDRAKDWPIEFAEAIVPGANLAGVWPNLALWALTAAKQQVSTELREVLQAEAEGKTSEWLVPQPAPHRFHSQLPLAEQFAVMSRRSWEGFRITSIIAQLVDKHGIAIEAVARKTLEIVRRARAA
jgi:hypothetical protein